MFQHRQQWKKKIAGLNGSVNAIGAAKEIENNEYLCVLDVYGTIVKHAHFDFNTVPILMVGMA